MRESALMESVYSHAVLCIAAAAALDVRNGLFFERNPRSVPEFRVDVSTSQENPRKYIATDPRMWQKNVEESPLNRRAWVCQERILSTRTLYFGEKQCFWECSQKRACELFPKVAPDAINWAPRIKISNGLLSAPSSDASITWNEIVRNYSRGALTYGSDKLVAISAVARQYASIIGTDVQYLAGIWRKHLEYQ
jgi:hypothetical protein